jgi:hypothetical protein
VASQTDTLSGRLAARPRPCSAALGQLSTSFLRLKHASPPGRSLLPDAVELAGQPTGARYPRTLSLPQSSLHGESRAHRVSLAHYRRMNVARHTRRVVVLPGSVSRSILVMTYQMRLILECDAEKQYVLISDLSRDRRRSLIALSQLQTASLSGHAV